MPCGIAWQARQATAAGPLPAPADGLPAYLSPQAAQLLVGVSVYRVLVGRQRFATVSRYVAVRPGTWMMRANGQAERTADQVKLTAGSIHTIVVLDHTGHLALDPLQYAAGSRVTPQGAPPTGLGGTAARPGPGLLPGAGALAAGLVLTLAGGLALRRRRIAWRATR